jgi:hypothetical protein
MHSGGLRDATKLLLLLLLLYTVLPPFPAAKLDGAF